MKYLLMIYANETWEQAQPQGWDDALVSRYIAVAEDLQKQGVYLDGRRLAPVETATSVQVRNGETLISDGPFAETKEQLGGFFLVDCRDLDHATEVAAMIPSAEYGTVEVRPLFYQD
ncbi:YciI family protein [Planctobacterium marinum]|uniref:YCII-related domain-containing protein n=1 Tax=Planctobacterium marinum TaxID=1631968 RepID=A0AA48HSE2_9ALTE|nr:hypothetical protein MACH26_04990 [Planctobacterium marinum]